jgi:protein TonB
MNGSLNLKIFLSFSLGLHLLFASVMMVLYPNFQINRFPPLNMEVFLYPLIPETKTLTKKVNKEESIFRQDIKKMESEERVVVRKEKKEEPAFKKEREPESPSIQTAEVKVNPPASVPQPVPPDNGKREVVNRSEAKKEKEPIVQAMNISLQSDSTLTFEKENSSIGLRQPEVSHRNPPPDTDSFDGQKNIVRLPSSSEADSPPKPVKRVNPVYPRWAKERNYQGEVILRVQLLSDGRVGEIEVKKSSGHEILDRSAIAAVKQWEFIPGREGNTPIWYWVNIPVKFQLQ